MKRMLIVVAAVAVLAPLTAHAQERMSDARYLAASRCLAYADLEPLQSDPADFTSLRETANVGQRPPAIRERARTDVRNIRHIARSLDAAQLRTRREDACAAFAERGLVQLGGAGAS